MKNIRLGIKTCLMYLARLFKVILYNIFYYLDFNILIKAFKNHLFLYNAETVLECKFSNIRSCEVLVQRKQATRLYFPDREIGFFLAWHSNLARSWDHENQKKFQTYLLRKLSTIILFSDCHLILNVYIFFFFLPCLI